MELEAYLICHTCVVTVFKLYRVPAELSGGYEGVFTNQVTDLENLAVPPGTNKTKCPDCGAALTRVPLDG